MPDVVHATLEDLTIRARRLVTPGERRLLGITGSPGAGKSTLAAALVEALRGDAALVPMDGFHLANEELRRLGKQDRKGAPDTFDALGFAALLARLRRRDEPLVYAPRFDRQLEASIGSALPVPADVPLIVTEGNYLLLDGPWRAARSHLDEVWFLTLPGPERLRRLIARHEAHGRTPEAARNWVQAVDERNARLIDATQDLADLNVHLH
ncbi:nucleoside/nucleotide kinase family protein (plasmid) [Deinococcus taeanensis]|uniref:nucleoside/nucleotide kinase family protein n=1 Tax=Deinococcus taeanensis TaxID=2737050 RepID=UPI001CDBC637|nr:nucleoside/nucleotide kinase family protein [Deinococcus taeanensis]UBV45163.1 nucleoside/nucleotide kinase family protein [Deinococcus taeanensis]